MPHLIDSNYVVQYLDGNAEAVQLIEQLIEIGLAISVITYLEVFEGLTKSPDPDALKRRFDYLFAVVPILPVTVEIAEHCALIRRSLRAAGRRINSRMLDLLIAATAMEHSLTLVTRNLADFRDIDGLSLQPQP